ncbi:DNA internalization-related competence protein ComEC/Rec2 [Bordetella hinzii]|uniref:DNA internalization-related competence protein ComEC/Rec2 n=1 Tax=Bordetella hinzii TaxID=103855 RepID=UPI0009B7E8BC|nr:DNA internalization-related competence protein ComEC/Rec2 [Bordetella hinzii]QDJ39214.1 DNA internalization-related competence protein ComEC/Rec2 [Bordetella hinzii]QDJ52704.1 DNA internalization-related competence protein ComEC/Rec2 [Bordetella hinzii]WPL80289.1 DNA internalization-related competence protein ComEC/Rec2 [Bordetella hinzii]
MCLGAAAVWRRRLAIKGGMGWLVLLAALAALWRGAAWDSGLLAGEHDNQIFVLPLTVASLAQGDAGGRTFTAQLDASRPSGIPARVRVTWRALPGGKVPELVPGQRWRMALVLRRPYGPANPHGPHRERRLHAEGVGATASVRGQPRLLAPPRGHALERARHRLRARLADVLGERPYAGVITALVMGDQQSVRREDWRVFNRTGITHLVSISGLHVTMLSGLAAAVARWVWPRIRWRGRHVAERWAAQRVAALAAVIVALGYCLLAGWSVPTRRTFFMLAVVAWALQARLSFGPATILLLAAMAVVVLDPWAVMTPGFWLSFGAVAILMRVVLTPRSGSRGQRLRAAAWDFCRTQMAVTLGLLPLLAFWVGEVSVVSPLANAVAIPWVSLWVTPLALLTGLFASLPGALADGLAAGLGAVAHEGFAWLMGALSWLAQWPWATLPVAASPLWILLLALAGVAWALQGWGWPARWVGWLCVLPMLAWRPERPAEGGWRLTALDVGQGTAVVVETARHVLLYDTGPRHYRSWDAGERLVLPYLRARGITRLDHLVVSHADLDHAGGLLSVLSAMPVAQSWASFALPAWLARERRLRERDGEVLPAVLPRPARQHECRAGLSWEMDGVRLRFLHPSGERALWPKGNNARSCVLLIEGRSHRALLPADVAAAQERDWAPMLPAVDVVLAPHHGSAGSSSPALVAAAQARHVIVQAGRFSRFGHPAPAAVRRWERAGARVWRTDRDGAVVVESGARLRVTGWRQERWNGFLP